MSSEDLPVTELRNAITMKMDEADPASFVRLLREADAQMFSGFGGHPGLLDHSVVEAAAHCVLAVAAVLREPEVGAVVLGGCGTSGRVGYLVARGCNVQLRERGY